MATQFVAGKDFTANGSNFTGKGAVLSEFRSLQADLNAFAKVSGYEAIAIDGIVGTDTLSALNNVVATVAANGALAPTPFTASSVEDVARNTPAIREWLQTTAAKTLDVSTFKVLKRGEGQDWNVKGDIAYGKGAVHDDFLGIQRELNKVASVVGFKPLEVDGMIGPKTAEAVKETYEKVVAKNPLFRITMFPPPDTKEETAAYAQFILGWLRDTAVKQLGTASA
jgi:hypothetical protein